MKTLIQSNFSRHGFARAVSNYLIALALIFLALPGSLSAQTLLHRYSFVSDASDSVGGANGTIVAPNGGSAATISSGLSLPGGGGGGFSGYVSLPSGILTNTASLTVECWVTQNQANTWATPWYFAIDGSHKYGQITHTRHNTDNIEVAMTPNGNEEQL